MKCKKCKRDIPENSLFCNWCGTRQIRESSGLNLPEPVQRGNSWRVQITVGGKRKSITAPTKREVLAKAQEARSHAEEIENDAAAITLGEAVDQYIADRSSVLSPSTIAGYKKIKRNYFTELYNCKVRDITPQIWQREVNDLSGKVSPKSVRNACGLIVSVADKLCGVKLEARMPPKNAPHHAFLEPDQIIQFISLFREQRSEAAVLLGLHSLRLSEILGLMPQDIDLQNSTIHVHRSIVADENGKLVAKGVTKTASSTRTIPILIPRLRELLQEHPDCIPVQLTHNVIYNDIFRACEDMGIDNIGIHGLRHSFASLCAHLQPQVPEQECMELGGWNNPQIMREIYTHIAAVDKAKSESALKTFFEGKESKKQPSS